MLTVANSFYTHGQLSMTLSS